MNYWKAPKNPLIWLGCGIMVCALAVMALTVNAADDTVINPLTKPLPTQRGESRSYPFRLHTNDPYAVLVVFDPRGPLAEKDKDFTNVNKAQALGCNLVWKLTDKKGETSQGQCQSLTPSALGAEGRLWYRIRGPELHRAGDYVLEIQNLGDLSAYREAGPKVEVWMSSAAHETRLLVSEVGTYGGLLALAGGFFLAAFGFVKAADGEKRQ